MDLEICLTVNAFFVFKECIQSYENNSKNFIRQSMQTLTVYAYSFAILRVTNVFRLKLKHETESAFISKLLQIAKQQFLNIFVNSS